MNLQKPFHYALPVNEQLFHNGLYVTNAGWEKVEPNQVYPNSNHPSFYQFSWESGRAIPALTIAWLMAGRREFQTHIQHLSLSVGQVFLILPSEWRSKPSSCELDLAATCRCGKHF